MILEGIVTTLNADGTTNISPMGISPIGITPMGPAVESTTFNHLVLKPYQTSTTYQNLKRHGEGVFHVTDDVELLARAAVGRLTSLPPLIDASGITGKIIADCCRWYAFRVTTLEDTQARTTINAEVIEQGRQRDFIGFHRAKHAVVEAAILATRVGFLAAGEIESEFKRLAPLVEKTASEQERRAFDFLEQYVQEQLESNPGKIS